MSGDWDDDMDPEIRESVMDATRRAMGLPTRNGGFVVGATDGRKPTPTPTGWHSNYEVEPKRRK